MDTQDPRILVAQLKLLRAQRAVLQATLLPGNHPGYDQWQQDIARLTETIGVLDDKLHSEFSVRLELKA